MDTITHTLFGLALYGAVKKPDMTRKQKRLRGHLEQKLPLDRLSHGGKAAIQG
ncbi:hypothetical protein [Paenibacillus sp. S25]|uniref:hypothetical protein n=1 Tax=Paenibacillus sp. S25 TaxID=2823905 RepID=UPI001C64CC9D|nr:hypothetical protein [Paenibacillus sp. S25]QYK60342.1 hypothetical protein KAI37_00652 [Paenibacillus sp. S25]